MSGTVFYNDIWGTASTVVMSNADADHPVTELDKRNPLAVAKSTGLTTEIVLSMPAAVEIQGIAFCNTVNLTTKNFQAHTADAWGAPDESQAMTIKSRVVNGTTYYWCYTEANWTKQYYRLELGIGAGVVSLACPILFIKNYDFIKTFGTPQYTKGKEKFFRVNQTDGGQILRQRKWSRSILGMDFRGLVAAQVAIFDDELGEQDYCYLFPDGATGDLFFGIMSFDLPVVAPAAIVHYSMKCGFIESPFF